MFEGFCEQEVDGNFNILSLTAAVLDNFQAFKKHTRVIFVLLVFRYLSLVLLQKPCKVRSAPKRCHILPSSRLNVYYISWFK